MTSYEGMFIIDPDLPGDGARHASAAISETITKLGGTVASAQEWGRRRLAYMIRKKREGNYLLVHFHLPPGAVAKAHAQFRLNEAILKTLITKRDPSVKAPEPEPARTAGTF